MNSPSETQVGQSSSHGPVLSVDFQWKKWKARIADVNHPSNPLYIVDFNAIKSPHIVFKSAADEETVGSGTLHPISIHANYEVHGRKGKLKALKRFHTSYTHLSYAYSDNGSPVTMTWSSGCGFKTWDFICLDENQLPVAKFSASAWKMTKVGNIEFLGPKATSPQARDEIVVTGLALFYCMMLRASSILSFFGAVFARPGPIEDEAATNPQYGEGGKETRDGKLSSGQGSSFHDKTVAV